MFESVPVLLAVIALAVAIAGLIFPPRGAVLALVGVLLLCVAFLAGAVL